MSALKEFSGRVAGFQFLNAKLNTETQTQKQIYSLYLSEELRDPLCRASCCSAALMTADCTLNPDYTSETHENIASKTLKEKSTLSGMFSFSKTKLLSAVPQDGKLSEKRGNP